MNEDGIKHLQDTLNKHIEQHDEDNKKLLRWAITILIGLIGSTATWFMSVGALEEKVLQLEKQKENIVTRAEWEGSLSLFNEKFSNINEKLDDIKEALKIK